MRVGLFIPCYVDQLYPDVGLAALEVLENLGVDVVYPEDQTCCGQPMANSGCSEDARTLAHRFLRVFRGFGAVVCPSGSCVSMVRHHYEPFLAGESGFPELRENTFELCEFITDVLGVERIEGRFARRVGLHQSCHGLRMLGLGGPSELMAKRHDKARQLLSSIDGLELVSLSRPDECCGFGGTFAVNEPEVSAMMGLDRIADHERAGAEVVTATDMSCLMHLEGLLRRRNKALQVLHVAQIFAGRTVPMSGGAAANKKNAQEREP
jgi:L-lactate dehydrogenase complex protein LldE